MFLYNPSAPTALLSYQDQGKASMLDVGAAQLETFLYEDRSNSRQTNLDREKWREILKAQEAMPHLFQQDEADLYEGEGHAIDIINQARQESADLRNKLRISDYDDIVAANMDDLKQIDSSIRDISQIDEDIAAQAKKLREEYERTAARANPWDAFWGTMGGGALGAMADPLNLAIAPIGFGSTSMAQGFMRGVAIAFGKNMALGLGAETAIQFGGVMQYKEEIGSPYDLGDALMNIAFAGIGEGILGGMGYGILRGAKKVRDSWGLSKEQEAVVDYIQKLQDIADQHDVTSVGQLEAHVKALNEIQKEIQAGRIPDVSALANRVHREYLDDFNGDIEAAEVKIAELEARKAELEAQLNKDVAAQQAKLQKDADFKLSRSEKKKVKAAQEAAAAARPEPGKETKLTQEATLAALKGEQRVKWIDEDSRRLMAKSEKAKVAQAELKASKKEFGDQAAIKSEIEKVDTRLLENNEFKAKVIKSRDDYINQEAASTGKRLANAKGETPKQRSFKWMVNKMLGEMGALGLKVNVFQGKAPTLGDNVRYSLAEGAVSTRVPTAKAATEDPLTQDLRVGLETDLTDPATLEKNTGKILEYENYKPAKEGETPEEIARNFVQHVKDNLLWLHSLVPEDIRERSHMWYTGANRITETLAARYGYSNQQSAGVMAVLSPQKDWYMNASLGERVMEIFTNHKNTAWSPEMEAVAADPTLVGSGKAKAPKGILVRNETNKKLYEAIQGKTLGELEDDLEIAAWVRVFDEAHHNRGHRVVTPEGDFVDFATTKNGSQKVTGWGSFAEIAKAISVLRDGSPANISAQMGGMHKVRNFYNNILVPDSPNGHVTIDTHAVAAGLLKPLAGNHLEVGHNFGTGAASSSKTGSKGTYGMYAEAYRQAAEEVGILPRQMQSITWEAVRGMFSPAFKGKKANQELINSIWQEYKDGKITLDQAREVILEKADGIEDPTWHRPDSDLADTEWPSSYKTDVSPGSISRDHQLGGSTGARAGNDAAGTSADSIKGQEGSATTQVATTTGSYRKAVTKAVELRPGTESVLDYGAGLGLGTDAMRAESGLNVKSYEPFPERWKGESPVDYTDSSAIDGKFDAVVNLNVLNVLEPELREMVARDIMSKIKEGGVAVIGTRGWKGDVNAAKKATPADEDKALWIHKSSGDVYQKGFDGNELKEYLEALAPEGYSVERGKGIANNTVYVYNNNQVRHSMGKDGQVEAAIDPETGELHLNLDAFESEEHLLKVLREEVIGHFGLRKVLGDKFEQVTNGIQSIAYHNPEIRQTWKDLAGVDPRTGKVVDESAPYFGKASDVIADEIISKMAREELTWSQAALVKVQALLNKILRAMKLVKDPITVSEMKALVLKSEKKLKKNAVKHDGSFNLSRMNNYANATAAEDTIALEDALDSDARATIESPDDGTTIIDPEGNEVNYKRSLAASERELAALDEIEACSV